MEEKQSMEELLKKLEEADKVKIRYAKRQYHMSLVTAFCSILILFGVAWACYTLVPKLDRSLDEFQTVAQELDVVAKQLSDADLQGMVKHVDQMAVTSESGVKEALEKINSINIDELNQAIASLSEVVEPLAKFAGIFK
jgi:hypothetical protein